MIFGHSDREQHRIKLGLAFLVIGVVLVLWAWGSWIFRATTRAESSVVAAKSTIESSPEKLKVVRAAPSVLLTVGIVVLIFLVSSYVFVRASRRYRLGLIRKAPAPTDTTDVWAMNKPRSFDDSDA